MNKSFSSKLILILSGVVASACGLLGLGGKGGGDSGELVGVSGREGWVMTIPYGMVPIPAGTFHMGQADEDPASTQINFNKQVTIGSFFMDDTEITNNEYRQFTNFFLVDNGSIEGFETVDAETFRQKYYPDTAAWVRILPIIWVILFKIITIGIQAMTTILWWGLTGTLLYSLDSGELLT